MTHDPKRLQAVVEAATPPGTELAFRPMFGGIMGYAGGVVFASLSDIGLGLKLAGADHTDLLAYDGAVPLRYETDAPPSKSYVVVPTAILDDPAALREWIMRSIAGLKPAKPRVAKRQ